VLSWYVLWCLRKTRRFSTMPQWRMYWGLGSWWVVWVLQNMWKRSPKKISFLWMVERRTCPIVGMWSWRKTSQHNRLLWSCLSWLARKHRFSNWKWSKNINLAFQRWPGNFSLSRHIKVLWFDKDLQNVSVRKVFRTMLPNLQGFIRHQLLFSCFQQFQFATIRYGFQGYHSVNYHFVE